MKNAFANYSRPFITGHSQAVRLPKEFRFEEDEVYLTKIDGVVMIVPRDKVWAVAEGAVDRFTDDYMRSRGDDIPDARDTGA